MEKVPRPQSAGMVIHVIFAARALEYDTCVPSTKLATAGARETILHVLGSHIPAP